MRIGTVVTATDTNPLYVEFIPMFVKAWKKVLPEADIHILLIAETIPEEYVIYKENIILVKPIPGIHTAFHAQCIRLLYPREVKRNTEAVIITDMDMIPLNNSYYTKPIEYIDNDVFIVYRDVLLPEEIPMCYVAALPNIWSSIFGIDKTDIILKHWYKCSNYSSIHGGSGWTTDQLILSKLIRMWDGKKIILNDTLTKYNRLERDDICMISQSNIELLKEKIKAGEYSDYHCLRPFRKFADLNNLIVDSL